jgi:hypothetical protein
MTKVQKARSGGRGAGVEAAEHLARLINQVETMGRTPLAIPDQSKNVMRSRQANVQIDTLVNPIEPVAIHIPNVRRDFDFGYGICVTHQDQNQPPGADFSQQLGQFDARDFPHNLRQGAQRLALGAAKGSSYVYRPRLRIFSYVSLDGAAPIRPITPP